MARRGRNFELAYKWLYDLNQDKYTVKSPEYIYDKTNHEKREVDVLITYCDDDNKTRRIAVECRDRKKKQDLRWIEQLVTKKEDLELDYIIAVTTEQFTKGAKDKAKYHGVIIEEARFLDNKAVEVLSHSFFVDLFFFKFDVIDLKFLIGGKIMSFKDVYKKIGLADKCDLLHFLNCDYYFSFDPYDIMKECNIDEDIFFKHADNSHIIRNNYVAFDDKSPSIIKKLSIEKMHIVVKLIPYKVSLPLNKSLSVIDAESKMNKKYSAFFGTSDEYVKIGYLDDFKVINIFKFKEREYYRFVGANANINTIFPNGLNNCSINDSEFVNSVLGKFDLNNII